MLIAVGLWLIHHFFIATVWCIDSMDSNEKIAFVFVLVAPY